MRLLQHPYNHVSLRHTAAHAIMRSQTGRIMWAGQRASPMPTFQELPAALSALLVGHVLIFRRGSLLMGWQPTALAVIWFGANSSSHGPSPGVHTGQMQSRMTVHSLWITFYDLRTRTHGHEYTLASWAKQGRDWSNQGRSVLVYAFPALVTLPRCQPLVASCRICFKPTAGMLNDPG